MIRTEEEARRWTALVESKVANGFIISDHQPIYPTLATLTGRRSRFLIKCKNVSFISHLIGFCLVLAIWSTLMLELLAAIRFQHLFRIDKSDFILYLGYVR